MGEAASLRIEGQHRFEAPREVVWSALLDPQVLARTLPGCERLDRTAENEFHGALAIKIGPVQGRFDGTVRLSDLQPPEGYHLKLHGQGAPGFVDGEGAIRLEAQDAATLLHYAIDAQVGGRIASVGQRLIDSSARVITRQALELLDQQIRALHQAQLQPRAAASAPPAPEPALAAAAEPEALSDAAPGPAAAPPAGAPAAAGAPPGSMPAEAGRAPLQIRTPSQAQFALRFVRELTNELMPSRLQRLAVLAVGAGVLVLLAVLLVRACGGTG
jgi:carbon monoxide dehydrogenase subunit G